uniref:ATP synthase F0 subunit 8 n=1 Tax=Nipponacmea moskalevi TaxID=1357978 RepID=UPI002114EA2C|nr:ATP synthase F0 subunit 8 [Nipponacmea moskalevi]USS60644.1 ATP synthase F0 subunit 8 [Nipponacmea nigrans]WKR34941.1 ATP synthase F0 subunit 8 [Nipponacmea moskalevi]
MPHFGPINWIMVFLLSWMSVWSVILEIYWTVPGHFHWSKPVKKGLRTYTWSW